MMRVKMTIKMTCASVVSPRIAAPPPPSPAPAPPKKVNQQKRIVSSQSIFLVESERSASGGELVDLDHGLAYGGCRVAQGVGGGVGESGKRAPGCNQRGAGRIRMRAHLRAPASSLSWVTRTGSSKMPHGTWQCERDSGASALARGRARSSPLRASIWFWRSREAVFFTRF